MNELGYSMTAEVKILRRKHKVTFRVGMRAEDLITALKNVPQDATVDEALKFEYKDEVLDGESYGDCACASIEFHEEVVER